jgi:glycosyltransferase involved in cell wall biosynthesis
MKIGLVALSDFQALPTGGTLMFLRRFIQSVAELHDLRLSLVGWSYSPVASRSHDGHVVRGPEFHPVGAGAFHRLVPDRLQFYWDAAGWKHALNCAGDVDVYYCHSPEAALRTSQFGKSAPIALHLHGAINSVGRSRFPLGRFRPISALYEKTLLGSAIRKSRMVFSTVSTSDFGRLCRGNWIPEGVPCRRIPAMVDLPAVRPFPTRPDRLRLVCVGRLEPVKGVDLLIDAVRRLIDQGGTYELNIVGDGSDRARLERLARQMGVASSVNFLGRLSPSEVIDVLAQSQVFLSGSHHEGFSLAMLEGLSLGLPAVVTDVGSAREVIREGETGYIVSRRDPDLFANRIRAAAAGVSRMRAECEKTAARYNSREVTMGIVEALGQIVSGGASTELPVMTGAIR